VVGQPGQRPKEYPRSPHGRILPPSNEPGLWAAEPPAASRSWTTGPPELFGVTLPFIPNAATAEDERPTRVCAQTMGALLAKAEPQAELAALPPQARRCLAARLYLKCAEELLGLFPEGGIPGSFVNFPAERRLHLAALATAKQFRDAACKDVVFPLRAEHAIVQVSRVWAQRLGEGKL
jgi:hypothetical protein